MDRCIAWDYPMALSGYCSTCIVLQTSFEGTSPVLLFLTVNFVGSVEQ